MPLWLILALGAGLIYLVKQGQAQATAATSSGGSTGTGGTSSYDDNIPTADSVAQAATVGQSVTLPAGTQLYSDGKLSNAAGVVQATGTGLVVTATAVGTAADGRVSISYTDAAGNTWWAAQPGT